MTEPATYVTAPSATIHLTRDERRTLCGLVIAEAWEFGDQTVSALVATCQRCTATFKVLAAPPRPALVGLVTIDAAPGGYTVTQHASWTAPAPIRQDERGTLTDALALAEYVAARNTGCRIVNRTEGDRP